MGDLGLGWSDLFVAAIVTCCLIIWARQEQGRIDRQRARDEYLARTLCGRD